ncbi:Transcription termination/antitermination protein NusG [Streptomyces badius]
MSDPNLNDAVEPEAGASESAKDELDIVEAADSVEPDQAEAAEGEDAAADEAAETVEEEAVEVADEEEAEPAAPVDPIAALRDELRTLPGEWYVIHTYAGYEKRVKANLEQRAVSLNVEEFIYQAEVPEEEIVQIKNGERKNVRQNKLPGYVLVRMDLTNESWGVVRNTPGVTGFVGNAYDPYPLTLDEIVKMLAPEAEEKAAREAAEAEGKPSGPQGRGPGARLRGRRLGHRHRRPVRHAAGHDQRDQRRLEEGQGPRRDLRPRDPGRAELRPDPEELGASRRFLDTCLPSRSEGLRSRSDLLGFGRTAIPVIVVRYASIRMTGSAAKHSH